MRRPLRGVTACPGIVQAVVLWVGNPAKPVRPRRGAIVVAPYTTPVIAPALTHAAGIICERGGLTSHGAIVAREFGVPCLVGVHGALRKLRDGELVILDATAGYVHRTQPTGAAAD